MAALTITNVALDGNFNLTDNLTSAAGGGDTVAYDDDVYIIVTNGDASSKTVTFTVADTSETTPKGVYTSTDLAVAVAAGKTHIFNLSQSKYRNSSGNIAITYSAVTSVTVGAIRLKRG